MKIFFSTQHSTEATSPDNGISASVCLTDINHSARGDGSSRGLQILQDSEKRCTHNLHVFV